MLKIDFAFRATLLLYVTICLCSTSHAGDEGRALAGAAVASVASEVCPGYTMGVEPAFRLKSAGIRAEDIVKGGKHFEIMQMGLRIMTAQWQKNNLEFCAFASKHRLDMD